MPTRRSTRASSGKDPEESSLFRGEESPSPGTSASRDVMQVETDLGLGPSSTTVATSSSPGMGAIDVDMVEAAAPSVSQDEPTLAKQIVDAPADTASHLAPQTDAPNMSGSPDKGAAKSTLAHDQPADHSGGQLLASLPVYYSASLPSSSTLQIFQYPTYPRGRPLPIPQIARERGVRPAMRARPRAKRVEVELPLDLRAPVYNAEKGEEYGQGAAAAGGPIGPGVPAKPERRVKSEFGGMMAEPTPSKARLERTRLESSLMPHQTQYMIGVIRDKALHLTPVDSVHQLRPSMHYLDALEAMERQKKAGEQREEEEEEEEGNPSGRANGRGAAKETKRKVQNLNVSIRGDTVGAGMGPRPGKPGGLDSRDLLMQAEREAESEAWVELEWKNEETDEARKTFDSQLFAASKTPLECKTRPREFLQHM